MIYDLFAVPIAIKHYSDTKKIKRPKAPYLIKFSFLTLEGKSKCSQRYLDFESVKEYGTDVENQAWYMIWIFAWSYKENRQQWKIPWWAWSLLLSRQQEQMFDLCFGVGNQIFDHREDNMWCWSYFYWVDWYQSTRSTNSQKGKWYHEKKGYFTCKKLNKKKQKKKLRHWYAWWCWFSDKCNLCMFPGSVSYIQWQL